MIVCAALTVTMDVAADGGDANVSEALLDPCGDNPLPVMAKAAILLPANAAATLAVLSLSIAALLLLCAEAVFRLVMMGSGGAVVWGLRGECGCE